MNVLDLDQLAQDKTAKNYSAFFPLNTSAAASDTIRKVLLQADVLVFGAAQIQLIQNLNQFIETQSIKTGFYKILQTMGAQISAHDLIAIKPDFVLAQNNANEREKLFELIKIEQSKTKQISLKKNEVIKKSEELESFNLILSKESEKKIELIRKFLEIEEGRKKNEKKLLYFLDLINLEIA